MSDMSFSNSHSLVLTLGATCSSLGYPGAVWEPDYQNIQRFFLEDKSRLGEEGGFFFFFMHIYSFFFFGGTGA
jgi:hypothetical protein